MHRPGKANKARDLGLTLNQTSFFFSYPYFIYDVPQIYTVMEFTAKGKFSPSKQLVEPLRQWIIKSSLPCLEGWTAIIRAGTHPNPCLYCMEVGHLAETDRCLNLMVASFSRPKFDALIFVRVRGGGEKDFAKFSNGSCMDP